MVPACGAQQTRVCRRVHPEGGGYDRAAGVGDVHERRRGDARPVVPGHPGPRRAPSGRVDPPGCGWPGRRVHGDRPAPRRVGLCRAGPRLEGSRGRPDGWTRVLRSAGSDVFPRIGRTGRSQEIGRLWLLSRWGARAHGGPSARGHHPCGRHLPRFRVSAGGGSARCRALRPRRGCERPHAGPARYGGRAGAHGGHASDGGADAGPWQGLHLRVSTTAPATALPCAPTPAMPRMRRSRASTRPSASWRDICPSLAKIGAVRRARERRRVHNSPVSVRLLYWTSGSRQHSGKLLVVCDQDTPRQRRTIQAVPLCASRQYI